MTFDLKNRPNKPFPKLQRYSQSDKMELSLEIQDQPHQTFDSSGIFSDSEVDYNQSLRIPRTTYRDVNGRIRSLVARSSSAERRKNFLLTQSCQVESVSAFLSKGERQKKRRYSRDCYDIRVQMGNANSTVEKIRHNTIDKIPVLKHDKNAVVPDTAKELEFVSFTGTPQNATPYSQIPNTFRPTSPAVTDVVVTMQLPQSTRSSAALPSNHGNRLSSVVPPTTQIPQGNRNAETFHASYNMDHASPPSYSNQSNRGYAATQILPPYSGRTKPRYAASQIGSYSNSNRRSVATQMDRNRQFAQDQIGEHEDDSFVMMPNLNKRPTKKVYSVIMPPSGNYSKAPCVFDGRARADSTAFGLSCDQSSTSSFIMNLKSDSDICNDICNTFWRPYLTFNQYKHGDEVVEFGSLWPDQNVLKSLLEEAYQATSLRRSVLDICKLVIRCGPVRVLQTLVNSRIIGVDQVFENGCSMLHLACLARNYDAVSYLISAGISQKILDKYGRTASQLCYDPRLRRQLSPQFRGGKFANNQCQSLKPASMHDKETIFLLAKGAKDYDELQIKLQCLDFDVNREMNRQGDYLVHVIARQGLSQLPQLLSLVRIEGACIEQYNQEGKTPLMIAAESENVVMVDVMLCILGANLNAPNPNTGECALHYAAKNNNVNVVNCLITRGADFNLEDSAGNRPDDTAAHYNAFDSQDVIVAHRDQRIQSLSGLAETGHLSTALIRVTDLYQTNNNGDTLIMTAAKHNRVENLLVLIEREGCHADAQQEKNGRTALAMASIVGHEEAVRELLKYDANPAICDIHQDLPLHHAIKYDHLGTVSTIIQYPTALTGLSKALKLCSTDGAHSLIRQAFQRRQTEIVTPDLFECALRGDARKLYCVLEEGDFANPTSGVGDWPLFLAADNGHTDVVILLHQYGGDVCRRHPSTKNTVLHAACFRGHTAIVKYLVENCRSEKKLSNIKHQRLDVNSLNAEMKTALQVAAEKGYSKIVRLLLNNGAACAFLDPSGSLFCCRDFQGVQVVIERKRESHTREVMALVRDYRKLPELRLLFQPKFDHNLRDKDGETPLMVACRFANLQVVKFLLESAIHNVTESDYDDETAEGESDTDSGTVMELVNTVSSTRIAKEPSQELVSVIEKQRRTSQCTIGMSDTDPDVTYTDFVESGDYRTSSGLIGPGAESRRPGGSRNTFDRREGPGWMMASTGHIEQSTTRVYGHHRSRSKDLERSRSRDIDAQTVPDIPNSRNLFNYNRRPSNSIFMTANVISHVCAVNSKDGRTPLHRALENGDHVGILLVLVETDDSCANIQDLEGWSPIHLACKLGRKKCVEKLSSLPYVDLNSRALDGKLPEEMSNNRHIVNTIVKAREQQPSSSNASLPTIEGSITGRSIEDGASTINFELLNEKFSNLKSQMAK